LFVLEEFVYNIVDTLVYHVRHCQYSAAMDVTPNIAERFLAPLRMAPDGLADCVKTPVMVRPFGLAQDRLLTTNRYLHSRNQDLAVRPELGRRALNEFHTVSRSEGSGAKM